jgi:hypothetical protein
VARQVRHEGAKTVCAFLEDYHVFSTVCSARLFLTAPQAPWSAVAELQPCSQM